MDPVSLVVTALVAGATRGLGDTASAAVKDAYGTLKSKLRSMLAGDASTELVLAEHELDPDTYEAPLRKKLEAAGMDALGKQNHLVLAAQQLLALTDPQGTRSGLYLIGTISADRGGVAIGGNNEGNVTAGYSESGSPARRLNEN